VTAARNKSLFFTCSYAFCRSERNSPCCILIFVEARTWARQLESPTHRPVALLQIVDFPEVWAHWWASRLCARENILSNVRKRAIGRSPPSRLGINTVMTSCSAVGHPCRCHRTTWQARASRQGSERTARALAGSPSGAAVRGESEGGLADLCC
jgi:hypothetical protein